MKVVLAPRGRGHLAPTPHRILFWMALAGVVALLVASPAAATEDQTRVLLVGDSITQGTGGDTAYRCDLWQLVADVDFVGTRTDAGDCAAPGFDPQHEGYGGHGLTDGPPGYPQLRLETFMSINGAFNLSYDAVLLHAGTNDKNSVNELWNEAYVDEIEAEMRTLISRLRENNPTATIFLAQLIPCGHGPGGPFLGCALTHAQMNARFAEIAADSSTVASPIVLIDHTRGFLVGSDLKPDLVHPNDAGSSKMAANWALGLETLLADESLAEPIAVSGATDLDWIPSDASFAGRPLGCGIVAGAGAWQSATVANDCSSGTFAAGDLPEGVYMFRYYATDYGSTSWGSATHFGEVTVTVDRTAPEWSSGEVTADRGVGSVALSWPSATDPGGIDRYVVYEDGVPAGEVTTTAWLGHGLAEGVTHTYAVEAVDAAGNRASLPAVETSALDLSAPTWPPGELRVVGRSGSSVTLTWPAATDNVAVDHYGLWADGLWLGDVEGGQLSHTVESLQPQYYTFTVTAHDADGNYATGPSVTTTTAAGHMPSGIGLVNAGARWDLTDADGDVTSFYFGTPGDYPFMGDWNCDGVDTPGLYRQSDGYVYLRNSNSFGPTDREFFFGIAGDIPIVGDFNGDGCDTVSIYRRGRVFIINELGQDGGNLGFAEYDYFFGVPGDVPFTGDFDADGIDEVGLFRQTNGYVYFTLTNPIGGAAATDNEFFFGIGGDQIVAGDWTSDLVDTVGIYRDSTYTFYLRYSNTLGFADEVIPMTTTGRPVAGAYDLG